MEGTVTVRRKEAMEALGISKWRFYALVERGEIRQHQLRDRRGRAIGRPLYLREDVERVAEQAEVV